MKKKSILIAAMAAMSLTIWGCGHGGESLPAQDTGEDSIQEVPEDSPAGTEEQAEAESRPEDSNAAPESEKAKDQETLPPYHYEGDDPYIESISQFAMEQFGGYYEASDICIPAITILEKDESDPENIKIWGSFWIYNYDRNGNILETQSGGENSGLLVIDGKSLLVKDVDLVGDGSDYDKDVKRIFGEREGLQELFYSEETEKQRDEDRRLQMKAYVEANGLDIIGYKDYGWESVMLDGSTPYHVPEEGVMEDASLWDHLKEGGKVRMQIENDQYTESGKSYTLDEFRDAVDRSLKDTWGEELQKHIKSISCAPVDRGGQLITQFILKIEAVNKDESDPLTIYYDINKLGDEYVAFGVKENYYRSFATVNRYGIYNTGGSGGAAIHYDGYSMTDPDGTPVNIYMCETDMALREPLISAYTIPKDFKLPEDYPEEDFTEDGVVRYVYSFESEPEYDMTAMEYKEGYDDYLRSLVYVFEKDDKGIFPDDKYMKLYKEAGIKVTDKKGIDEMIADRMESLGIDESMLTQPGDDKGMEPGWKEL